MLQGQLTQRRLLHNFVVCGHSTATAICLCRAGHCWAYLHILVFLPFVCICSGQSNKVSVYVEKLLLSPCLPQNLSVSKCTCRVHGTGNHMGPHWDQVPSSPGTATSAATQARAIQATTILGCGVFSPAGAFQNLVWKYRMCVL